MRKYAGYTVEELRALVKKATPAPWRHKWDSYNNEAVMRMDCDHPRGWRWAGRVRLRTKANADLVCASRNALAPLLDRVEKLEKACRAAANELGVRGAGYPAPVVNASNILLRALLSDPDDEKKRRQR